MSKGARSGAFPTEARVRKAWEMINSLAQVQQCRITPDYLALKLEELFLAHEYQEKVYEEKEEQRRNQKKSHQLFHALHPHPRFRQKL